MYTYRETACLEKKTLLCIRVGVFSKMYWKPILWRSLLQLKGVNKSRRTCNKCSSRIIQILLNLYVKICIIMRRLDGKILSLFATGSHKGRGVAWRGVAWRGVACRGVAWRGVAWRGVAWRGVAWRGVAWRGVAWRGVAWRGVAWRGVAWRGVAWRGVAWRGVAWRGVAWRGVAWRGVSVLLIPAQSNAFLIWSHRSST